MGRISPRIALPFHLGHASQIKLSQFFGGASKNLSGVSPVIGDAALMSDRKDGDPFRRDHVEDTAREPAGEAPTSVLLDKCSCLGVH